MNIFKDGILIDINVSFWSGAKVLTAGDLGLKDEEIVEAFNLGRKMLVPKDIIRRFRAIESKARHLVDQNSFKFPIGNARFIPKKKFPKILESLKEYQQEYNDAVGALVYNYETYRAEMIPVYENAAEIAFMKQLPSTHEFNIDDLEEEKAKFVSAFLKRINAHYPSADSLSGRFSLDWDVYEIALPRMRKSEADSIADTESKKQFADEEYKLQAQKKIGNFLDEVVMAMRKETAELCNHIIQNIKSGKVVREQTIQSMHNFIEKFSELNFVGDQKIEEQLSALKTEFLNVHTTKKISDDSELTGELQRRLHEISEMAIDMTDINSVTGEYRRKIDWQD